TSRFFPSGSICGQDNACSPFEASGIASGSGAPPVEGTRRRPELIVQEKMIDPSGDQVPPSVTGGTTARVVGRPPASDTFFSSREVKKPSHSPSGAKNGFPPPSVPAIGTAAGRSSARM